MESKIFKLEPDYIERCIERAYLPYWQWEEVEANMWGTVENRKEYLDRAIEFTGDAKLYGSYMLRVVEEWPNSCRHNLSNVSQNRQAWIGHAACAFAFECPEDIVRLAWSHITSKQQNEANARADFAIARWERVYA